MKVLDRNVGFGENLRFCGELEVLGRIGRFRGKVKVEWRSGG